MLYFNYFPKAQQYNTDKATFIDCRRKSEKKKEFSAPPIFLPFLFFFSYFCFCVQHPFVPISFFFSFSLPKDSSSIAGWRERVLIRVYLLVCTEINFNFHAFFAFLKLHFTFFYFNCKKLTFFFFFLYSPVLHASTFLSVSLLREWSLMGFQSQAFFTIFLGFLYFFFTFYVYLQMGFLDVERKLQKLVAFHFRIFPPTCFAQFLQLK